MSPDRRWAAFLVAVVSGVTAARVYTGWTQPLLGDEAYHWTWSQEPALGYYDQPPAIAWILAATRAVLGDAPQALRAPSLLAHAVGLAAILTVAGDRGFAALWWVALPPLAGLTLLAVPDAYLLAAWAVGLAAAHRGGRMWLLAGLAGGVASLSKYSGIALLPLLILGAGRRDWRSPWPWAGLALAVGMLAPNLYWNAAHDWVTFRFQLHEGLLHEQPPGLWGPARQVLDQVVVVTPFAAAAGVWWAVRARPTDDRITRLCWVSSVPLLVGFAVAAAGGPPEAGWPAPAWIGVGIGLSHARGRLASVAWVGAWLACFATLAVAAHVRAPLIPLPADPAARIAAGPVLAEGVARWTLPVGVAIGEAGVADATPVVTERYQEAALIAHGTGIRAAVLPGCGRASQYSLWPGPTPERALFVRPHTSGPPACALAVYPEVGRAQVLRGTDPAGRPVGPWDLFEVGQ